MTCGKEYYLLDPVHAFISRSSQHHASLHHSWTSGGEVFILHRDGNSSCRGLCRIHVCPHTAAAAFGNPGTAAARQAARDGESMSTRWLARVLRVHVIKVVADLALGL